MIILSHNDVVFGRGYAIINRPGNKRYRSLLINRKSLFDTATNEKKQMYAAEVVDIIHRHRGRFLKKGRRNAVGHSPWIEVDRKEAIRKARQAVRDMKKRPSQSLESDLMPPPCEDDKKSEVGQNVEDEEERVSTTHYTSILLLLFFVSHDPPLLVAIMVFDSLFLPIDVNFSSTIHCRTLIGMK